MTVTVDNDGWSSEWVTRQPKPPTVEETNILNEAKRRYSDCVDWEGEARVRFDYDYKFANGDAHNHYQWDTGLVNQRELEDRPCLTINKTNQHNLMIINDAKQNKPGIRIRPVGEEATYEAAQIYQELIYHIEYISSAENVYDSATTWQVEAGIGYWRVVTDFISPKSFDQEIYIRRIKDPRSVYLDPDINEVDGSDARFGFIFENMPKDLFIEKYPDFASVATSSVLGNIDDDWATKNEIKVVEYYRKSQNADKLVTFIKGNRGEQVLKYLSELDDTEKLMYREIKKNADAKALYQFRERDVLTDEIEWFKIAGDRIIEQKPWPGKYIPIIRLPGTETVIDGQLDRKGHTRALINAQQIYNYTSSANVEYGALQTKSPWIAPSAAIEGYEEYYKTANTTNHSYLPYNAIDDEGNAIPAPTRPQGPQPGTAYVQQMQIAQNEMMMVSGQYQAQFGENENAKSGVAINARQRQGDRATYHFIDNQAIAIRFTGKVVMDLIPKIYDTKRVRLITASDGSIMNVNIDPKATVGFQKTDKQMELDKGQKVQDIIFNPNVGMYDIQADTGPSYATKRMEAAAVLTEIAKTDKDFMKIGGDVYMGVLDFPKADVLADRYKKMLPPNITSDGPDPATEQLMQQAEQHITQQNAIIADLTQKLKSRDGELFIKAEQHDLEKDKVAVQEQREDYDAETRRLTAIGNAGPAVSVEQIQPILLRLLRDMGYTDLTAPGTHEGGTVAQTLGQEPQANGGASAGQGDASESEDSLPDVPGSRLAPDGQHYVPHEGGYARVEMQ